MDSPGRNAQHGRTGGGGMNGLTEGLRLAEEADASDTGDACTLLTQLEPSNLRR
jgi:hypothetical protein